MKRAFQMKQKTFFIVFEGLSFSENKKLIKNSRHKLQALFSFKYNFNSFSQEDFT